MRPSVRTCAVSIRRIIIYVRAGRARHIAQTGPSTCRGTCAHVRTHVLQRNGFRLSIHSQCVAAAKPGRHDKLLDIAVAQSQSPWRPQPPSNGRSSGPSSIARRRWRRRQRRAAHYNRCERTRQCSSIQQPRCRSCVRVCSAHVC